MQFDLLWKPVVEIGWNDILGLCKDVRWLEWDNIKGEGGKRYMTGLPMRIALTTSMTDWFAML